MHVDYHADAPRRHAVHDALRHPPLMRNNIMPYSQQLPTQCFSTAMAQTTQSATLVTAESWR
ncbi:hypothetical protein AL048_01505 [Pseudomonas syringae pv. castaneae]|nr:hypothetical protein AL048_01505 [Pseudomonas syringae pv. castaneae]